MSPIPSIFSSVKTPANTEQDTDDTVPAVGGDIHKEYYSESCRAQISQQYKCLNELQSV